MVVQHNLQAMNANRMLGVTTSSQAGSTEKLSSGYKINRAADDAAGLSISEKMRKQIRGLDQATANAEDGVSCVQTAEGALTEVHDMLQRMNELAVQASNGTLSEDDRTNIQDEIDQLVTEIDRVSETTKFNETYLLKGASTEKTKYMAAKDAGISGTIVDSATTASLTISALQDGDKVSIGGKQYTIGTTAANLQATVGKLSVGDSVTINGKTYTIAEKTNTGSALMSTDDAKELVKEGVTVRLSNGKEYAVLDTKLADSATATVISASTAYDKIKTELYVANRINDTENTATASYTAPAADATSVTFTVTKGSAKVADSLNLALHVGADADYTNKINLKLESMSATGLGISGLKVSDNSGKAATYAIDAISNAIATVSRQRSELGAVQNRLEHTIANLDNVVENTTSAESRIRDTDMAEEMVNYSKNNILQQAGQSMLAQANQSNQGVLSLLG